MSFVSNSDLMFKSKRPSRLPSTVEAYICVCVVYMFISNSCESDVSVNKVKSLKFEKFKKKS